MDTCDFLIIGGGIIGLTVARTLRTQHPNAKIVILEKEQSLGYHASGRNSGVLHAGFYYTADSLKAQFTRDGNREMTEYCRSRGLPVNNCGKLVVAKDEDDRKQFQVLLERARHNGVILNEISAEEAKKIEPRVNTHMSALFSPSTSSVSPLQVIEHMGRELQQDGVTIKLNSKFVEIIDEKRVRSTSGTISAGFMINCAGLHADQIARHFAYSERYRILPFKGLYLLSSESPGSLKTNIYPVPNLKNPFLGVHFTVTSTGHSKIGPTAIPALWREQYKGLSRFSFRELFSIGLDEMKLFFSSNFNFRDLARDEMKKVFKKELVRQARQMIPDIKDERHFQWGKPGIRAQLYDVDKKSLVMDFLVERKGNVIHVLNSVSPAFTCSIPFSRYICSMVP